MSRIDKIAQNGNDGLHYEETNMCEGKCKRDVLGLKDNEVSEVVDEVQERSSDENPNNTYGPITAYGLDKEGWDKMADEVDKEFYNRIKDDVNHPQHYTSHPSGVETIEITEHMNFCLGNAVKYIMRCELKGNKKQDLEKAIWYLQRELENVT